MNLKDIQVKRIRTGRIVRTWQYRGYVDNKPVRYKCKTIVSADSEKSLIQMLKYLEII